MADVAVLGGLLSQLLGLLVLGREPGDGKCLERGELGQRLVPFRDSFLEFGDLGLEPFDLRCPGVRGLIRVALGLQATLELLAQVLVGAGAGGAVAIRGMSLVSARCTGRRPDLVHYPLGSLHLGFQPLLLPLGEA